MGGGVNALFVVLERAVNEKDWYKKLPAIVKWFFTVAIIYFSWITFTSGNMSEIGKNYAALFVPMTTETVNFTWQYYLSRPTSMLLAIVMIGSLTGLKKFNAAIKEVFAANAGNVIKRILLLMLLTFDILFVVNSSYSPFIYFQF